MKRLFRAILMGSLPVITIVLTVVFIGLLIISINAFIHNVSYSLLITLFIIGWIIGTVEYYRNH